MADGNGATQPTSTGPKPPRVLWLSFASLRSAENQDVYARGLARLLVHDFNRTEPGVAAAAVLTARRGSVKGFVLPQVPSEPGPLVALGQQLQIPWIVQGFSRVTADEVDLQVQWVNSEKHQASAVARFSGKRPDLAKVLDQVRKIAGPAFGIEAAPSMPPPVWAQTNNPDALYAFLRYLDNSMLLYDPSERELVGELRDPIDYLNEAVKLDRAFRAASTALLAENKGDVNSFGPVLELDVSESALL
ncbi:MAG TPA: hypothetical protein VMV18_00850 [bacterium]|nr:hypothetical protein [bacterium]